MVFYVNSQESNSPEEIAFLLNKCILHHPARWSELIFLCIGSDRVTGDCLGPYVGYQLFEHLDAHGIYIYGTLKEPVHALNLEKISRHRRISWTKKAPGICDHSKWRTIPRCRSSKGTSTCW